MGDGLVRWAGEVDGNGSPMVNGEFLLPLDGADCCEKLERDGSDGPDGPWPGHGLINYGRSGLEKVFAL